MLTAVNNQSGYSNSGQWPELNDRFMELFPVNGTCATSLHRNSAEKKSRSVHFRSPLAETDIFSPRSSQINGIFNNVSNIDSRLKLSLSKG